MDYKKIGLMCGIEIHQQLEGKKLFCNCPTILRDDKPHFIVKRYLKASAGETGTVDVAAAQEQKKQNYYLYEGYKDTTCLVELDEEPPHDINTDCLGTCLQVSKMLKADIIEYIQVMRKTVVNGSNTSGFQRTALVATKGKIELESGTVGVDNICLEEDACKIIEQNEDHSIYRLDKLGIPLIEIGTAPDIKTPEQAKEVAAHIGMVLRSTGKAKRGIGTIRQDINVSIKGGTRVEIKGAQDLKTIPLWVENEAKRQQALIELKSQLKDYKSISPEIIEVTDLLKKTKCTFVKKIIESKGHVVAIKVDNFFGVIGKELLPNYRVGTELAGYAKVFGFGGIIHSDENLEKYKFSVEEIDSIKNKLKVKKSDAFIMVVGNKNKANDMLEHALIPRINQFSKGVPNEVRKPNANGTTSYMRPMPGAARMYPETDVKIITTTGVEVEMPELIEEKISRFEKMGISKDLATLAAKSEKCNTFENYVKRFKSIKPAFIAETLLSAPREIKRKFCVDAEKTPVALYEEIFTKLGEGKIGKDSVMNILVDFCKGKFKSMKDYELMSDKDLEKEIKIIIKDNSGLPFNALIGKAMGKLKGKADGKKIIQMLKTYS